MYFFTESSCDHGFFSHPATADQMDFASSEKHYCYSTPLTPSLVVTYIYQVHVRCVFTVQIDNKMNDITRQFFIQFRKYCLPILYYSCKILIICVEWIGRYLQSQSLITGVKENLLNVYVLQIKLLFPNFQIF